MAKKKKLKLEKFVSDSSRFVSIFKAIPISNLETVREIVKQSAKEVELMDSTKLEVRMRFRGPRYENPRDTYKSDAKEFDVYVNTCKFPSKLSAKKKKELKIVNRNLVRDFALINTEEDNFDSSLKAQLGL